MVVELIHPQMGLGPMDTGLKARMAPSLALLTIAGIIAKEHTAVIVDENVERIDFDRYADLVGITVTVDTLPRAAEIAEEFRRRGVKVIAGGIHITSSPETAAEYFDSLCIGTAERTWPRILEDAAAGRLQKVYADDGKISGEEIAPPDYGAVDRSEYLYTNIIHTSRGCPFRCNFCYNSCKGFQGVFVNRPIADVIAEIKRVNKKHVMFIDDNFIGNPGWTAEFLRALLPMHLKWNAAVSANIVDMPELLDLMKASGCQSLFIGFESLNPGAIKGARKSQNNTGAYERLVKELHKRGIMINASFVFGLDGDDAGTFQATLDWIVRNKIETVTSHILTPYPGTVLYDKLLKEGRITDFDLSHYNTAHVVFEPANMTREELYNGYIKLYRDIYSFRNIIRRLPEAGGQRMAYLAFNLFYRKFGRFTEKLCRLLSFYRIGRLAERAAYRIK